MDTRWYVLAGGVCSGKTATAEALRARGYRVMPEIAREVIEEEFKKGKSIETILRDEVFEFQIEVFRRQQEREKDLPKGEVIFFDRGMPDIRAYLTHYNIPEPADIAEALAQVSYRNVFLLASLPMEEDPARTETADERAVIHALLEDAHASLGLPITHIPVAPVEERVERILAALD